VPDKIIEQILRKIVLKHVKNKELIGDSQHDFTKGQIMPDKFGGLLQQDYSIDG